MKIEKAVIGMDFSEAAVATARWMADAFAPEAELILAHALEPDLDRFLPEVAYATSSAAALHEAASERTREVSRLLTTRRTRVEVRDGRAHDVLRAIAADTRADLIAVGPHRERSRKSRLLGTTADRLVRTTRVPVLVGSRAPATVTGRIVVGIDASSITSSVLAWGKYASDVLDAKITAVYALQPLVHAHPLSTARAGITSEEAAAPVTAVGAQQEIDWLRGEGRLAGIDLARFDCEVLYGDAATSLLEAATQQRADLMIVGRRDPIASLPALLGRTLRHVLHEANCAVLVVTPSEDQVMDEPE